MAASKKERERVREAMSKSLTAKPSRQQEIAEMMKGRLGTEDRKPDQLDSKKKGGEITLMATKKPRKDRSDMTVGSFEKKHGIPPGTVRNPGGRDTRSDKKIGTVRKEAGKKGGKK